MNAESLFRLALERPPDARGEFLNKACAGDPALRERVEALLRAHDGAEARPGLPTVDQAATFTDSGPETAEVPAPAAEVPGTPVGPYRLLRKVGEGGMGVVWLAEQERPVRRHVALKLVKAGLDSAQLLARFEQERQALARMDHPHIAKVLDAGTTEAGRHYFVMELVPGVPLTAYCDQERLTPRERLGLFVDVCSAVQHAHQKGVIHRDLKPSNVLVGIYDGKAVPKVIDFGVAKAVGQPLAERTLFTEQGQLVGTLEYMAPEQAGDNADVDTRADVYALGVILYELLTGSRPFVGRLPRGAPLTERLRVLREEEPPRPSARLADAEDLPELAARRGLEPRQLERAVRGDLDWVVMKCLEKERGRRYESASALARDVERYLHDEPVQAGPPSPAYRLRKFARKHRTALMTAEAVAALLVVGVVASVWQAVRATRAEAVARQRLEEVTRAEGQARQNESRARAEEEKARRSEARQRAVLGFFQDRVLAAARPEGLEGGLGKDVTLRAAVDTAEPAVAAAFAGQPEAEASVRDTLGTTYLDLGDAPRAIGQYERALALRRQALGEDSRETLASVTHLAQAYQDAGRLAEAVPLFERARKGCREKLGPDDPETLEAMNGLAGAYRAAGRLAEAVPLYERAWKLRTARLGPDDPSTLVSANDLAAAYRDAGRPADALPLFERVLKARRARLGPEHPGTLLSQNNLATAYRDAGRMGEALPLQEQALKGLRERLGPDHPLTLYARSNLAEAYRAAGRVAEALPLLEQVLRLQREKLGPDHPNTLQTMNSLALAYRAAGRAADAVPLLQELLRREKARRGADHPEALFALADLAAAYRDLGQFAAALPLFEEALKLSREKLGPDHPRTLGGMHNLALAYRDVGRPADALPLMEEALREMKAKLGPEHPDTVGTLGSLAALYRDAGRLAEALPLLEEVLRVRKAHLGPDHPDTLFATNNLAAAYWSARRLDRSVPLLEEAFRLQKAKLGPDHPNTLLSMINLATNYFSAGRRGDAVPLFEEAVRRGKAKLGPEHPYTVLAADNLAAVYEQAGDFTRAEPLCRDLVAARRKQSDGSPATAAALARLGLNLLNQKKYAEAEAPLREALTVRAQKQPDDWLRYNSQSLLGAALLGQKKYAEAEPLLRQGYEGMKQREAKVPAAGKPRLGEALGRLVALYDAWGKKDEAARWRKEQDDRRRALAASAR